ncbi:Ligatin [Operophtera brumata]|uniref:Ligatin n=1 Tax=Operophtera brumata TaxID=104452 RepID=A0A0L7L520_OPEBR|nr:Ligatin [Operophtera brumata]
MANVLAQVLGIIHDSGELRASLGTETNPKQYTRMFAKPYKLKSNNALKNSEKKHLAQRVQDEFPFATEEKVKEIVPQKGSYTCMKLVLHSGDFVNVYASDGVPMLIETPERLVPTVCALWKVPDLVPMLTIHAPVLAKIQNGAPLYLPGVSLPAQGAGFPVFQCGTMMGARTEDNAAACIVGSAAMSSADMLLRASGVCLDTLHVYGDALCKEQKFSRIERPTLAAPVPRPPGAGHLAGNFQQPCETSHDDEVPADMDELLKWCLLSFLKLEGKRAELPLKTNLLYKNHLQALCPPDRSLDVRAALTDYVKRRALSSPAARGLVTLDAALAAVMSRPEKEAVKWDALMAAVQSKMTASTEMTFADGTVKLTKTKLEPIKMTVSVRSGNKKVTLVSNLESFGFNLQALAHVCQLGIAASCGITRAPGAKSDQLMLQGDQALAHVCQLGIAASCGLTRAPGAKSDQLMLQGDQVRATS